MLSLLSFSKKETMFVTPDGRYPCNYECKDHFHEEALIPSNADKKVQKIAATFSAILSSSIVFTIIYFATDCFIEIKGLNNQRVFFFGELRLFQQLNRIVSISSAVLGFFIGWKSAKVKMEELDKKHYQKKC